jgi:hypothetical protein
MMNTRFAFAIVLVMELAACVTQDVPDRPGIPARTILDPLLTRRNPSAGIFAIRRDAATSADECRHRVLLDGNAVADLRPNEVVTIYAPPGPHILRAELTGPSCQGGNEIAATSEKGRLHSFITTNPSSSGVLLLATAE